MTPPAGSSPLSCTATAELGLCLLTAFIRLILRSGIRRRSLKLPWDFLIRNKKEPVNHHSHLKGKEYEEVSGANHGPGSRAWHGGFRRGANAVRFHVAKRSGWAIHEWPKALQVEIQQEGQAHQESQDQENPEVVGVLSTKRRRQDLSAPLAVCPRTAGRVRAEASHRGRAFKSLCRWESAPPWEPR